MSPFDVVSPVNWNRLARAYTFYTSKGFTYVETPWVVPMAVAKKSMPEEANPFFVAPSYGLDPHVLVGSAEQGFLSQLEESSLVEGKFYFSISPCFRGEPSNFLSAGVTQATFMKVELFCYGGNKENYITFLEYAKAFMLGEGVSCITSRTSEESIDLYAEGFELGSYGFRPETGSHYGTGLAEPRFSTVFHQVRKIHEPEYVNTLPLVSGDLYEVHARSFNFAVYDSEFEQFIGVRYKFSDRFLDYEVLRTPSNQGTVRVIKNTGKSFPLPLTRKGPTMLHSFTHSHELMQFLLENQETPPDAD